MESTNLLASQSGFDASSTQRCYYTVEETARLLRASQPSVLKLIRSGQVRGVKLGREWRILGGELLDMGARSEDTETGLVADWLEASKRSLAEIWDNDEDAVYDKAYQLMAADEAREVEALEWTEATLGDAADATGGVS